MEDGIEQVDGHEPAQAVARLRAGEVEGPLRAERPVELGLERVQHEVHLVNQQGRPLEDAQDARRRADDRVQPRGVVAAVVEEPPEQELLFRLVRKPAKRLLHSLGRRVHGERVARCGGRGVAFLSHA